MTLASREMNFAEYMPSIAESTIWPQLLLHLKMGGSQDGDKS
jgi:hypothetical protein